MASLFKPLILVLKHLFRKSFTIKYPYELRAPFERTVGKYRLLIDRCTGCALCEMDCPNEGIRMVEVEGRRLPQINYGRCCFCSICVYTCPRDAIQPTNDYELAEIYKGLLIHSPGLRSLPTSLRKEGRKVMEVEFRKTYASHKALKT